MDWQVKLAFAFGLQPSGFGSVVFNQCEKHYLARDLGAESKIVQLPNSKPICAVKRLLIRKAALFAAEKSADRSGKGRADRLLV